MVTFKLSMDFSIRLWFLSEQVAMGAIRGREFRDCPRWGCQQWRQSPANRLPSPPALPMRNEGGLRNEANRSFLLIRAGAQRGSGELRDESGQSLRGFSERGAEKSAFALQGPKE